MFAIKPALNVLPACLSSDHNQRLNKIDILKKECM